MLHGHSDSSAHSTQNRDYRLDNHFNNVVLFHNCFRFSLMIFIGISSRQAILPQEVSLLWQVQVFDPQEGGAEDKQLCYENQYAGVDFSLWRQEHPNQCEQHSANERRN